MPTPKEYADQINKLIADVPPFDPQNIPQVKYTIKAAKQVKKEIRQVKAQINLEMKEIRAAHKNPDASGAGFARFMGARGVARRIEANARRDAENAKNAAIEPYERLKLAIDRAVLELDKQIMELENSIEKPVK